MGSRVSSPLETKFKSRRLAPVYLPWSPPLPAAGVIGSSGGSFCLGQQKLASWHPEEPNSGTPKARPGSANPRRELRHVWAPAESPRPLALRVVGSSAFSYSL